MHAHVHVHVHVHVCLRSSFSVRVELLRTYPSPLWSMHYPLTVPAQALHTTTHRTQTNPPSLQQRAPRSCAVFIMTPPNEHSSEGGRDDRGVPYHAESTLSSAQMLKCSPSRADLLPSRFSVKNAIMTPKSTKDCRAAPRSCVPACSPGPGTVTTWYEWLRLPLPRVEGKRYADEQLERHLHQAALGQDSRGVL